MPDPVLKAAAEEIKAVLKKYDITAIITLNSPGSTEYVREVEASWSCAFFEQLPEGLCLRFRAKRVDYPSLEAQKEAIENTVGMIFAFLHQAKEDEEILIHILAMLQKTFPDMLNMIRKEMES